MYVYEQTLTLLVVHICFSTIFYSDRSSFGLVLLHTFFMPVVCEWAGFNTAEDLSPWEGYDEQKVRNTAGNCYRHEVVLQKRLHYSCGVITISDTTMNDLHFWLLLILSIRFTFSLWRKTLLTVGYYCVFTIWACVLH